MTAPAAGMKQFDADGPWWYPLADMPADEFRSVTLGVWGDYLIQLWPMLFTVRLVLIHKDRIHQYYDHGWCYPTPRAAILNAWGWNPAKQAEPACYVKVAGEGRTLPNG